MKGLLLLLTFVTLERQAKAFPPFQNLIPNGKNVTSPCNPNEFWPGVGHLNIQGGGDRNDFGRDFFANGKQWNSTLCEKDSDGDGLTNGDELGDPDCVWTPGSQPSRTTNITHPGVCEPTRKKECRETQVSSSRYTTQEEWLSKVCPKAQFICPGVTINRGADVQEVEFRLPTLQVPAKHTTYMCTIEQFPDLTQDYHVFAFTPEIDNGDVVHHIVVFAVPDDYPETGVHECGMVDNPNILGGWTLGLSGICFPPSIGFRFGLNGFKKILLQVHWNNQLLIANSTDSSGVRAYYTNQLRPYDAATLTIGQTSFQIKPGSPETVVTATCSETCTENIFTADIQVYAALPHMHLIGRKMKVSQYRNGQLIRYIFDDLYYDFNNPTFYGFLEPITLKPGDELRTECRFTSTDKNTTTYFGPATTDEMCYAFLIFAPAQNIPSGPFCIAWRDLLPCDNSTYKECNINDLNRFSASIFPSSRLFRSIMSSCQFHLITDILVKKTVDVKYKATDSTCLKPGYCARKCRKEIQKAKSREPCLRLQEPWQYVREKVLKTYENGTKFLKEYDSCDPV